MDLASLFAPQRVAVFCDSTRAASQDPGQQVASNLLQGGFGGEVGLIDPQADSLLGRACVRDPRDLSDRIDLALVASPPAECKRSVDRAIMAGARAVVLLTGLGPGDAALVEALRNLCASRSVALVGPGSPGVINLHQRFNAACSSDLPPAGPVAMLAESHALTLAMLDRAAALGLGVSKAIGLGDKAGLDEVELFRLLTDDRDTRVVIASLESIANGKEFLKRAEALAAVKPVVVLKAGSTRAGERAVAAHTGRTVAGEIAYGAAFRRAGVIRVDSFQGLFDLALALDRQPLPAGRRVAVVSNSGGPGILAADALELAGLDLAELGPATATAAGLDRANNPLELPHTTDAEQLAAAVRATLDDPGCDAALALVTPGLACRQADAAQQLSGATSKTKPLLVVTLGGQLADEARATLIRAGVPAYPSPVRAAATLSALAGYCAWLRRPPRVVTRFRVNRRRVERILLRHDRMGLRLLMGHLAREVLEAYDFHLPRGRLVASLEEAIDAAGRLGLPVRMQVVSADVPDPAGLGGLRSELASVEAVRDAWDLILLRVGRHLPDARIDGMFIESLPPPGQAVVLGMNRDAQFGPMLRFGLGGLGVEVMQDVAFHIAPITADEARQMLRSTRAYRLLEERSRQSGGIELDAVVVALQRISQLATDFPRIQELQIDPFVLTQPGADPLVGGVRIQLAVGGRP